MNPVAIDVQENQKADASNQENSKQPLSSTVASTSNIAQQQAQNKQEHGSRPQQQEFVNSEPAKVERKVISQQKQTSTEQPVVCLLP